MGEAEAARLPDGATDRAPRLALAIAAKEAASKALGTGWSRGVCWRDVVVDLGPPLAVRLEGGALALGAPARIRRRRRAPRSKCAATSSSARCDSSRDRAPAAGTPGGATSSWSASPSSWSSWASRSCCPSCPSTCGSSGSPATKRPRPGRACSSASRLCWPGSWPRCGAAWATATGRSRWPCARSSSYVVLLALSRRRSRRSWQLLALRTAVGLFGGMGPLGLAMATALAPREQTGRAVGSIQSAQILAAAVGPLAGGVLAHTIGMRLTFVATAAACARRPAPARLLLRGAAARASAPRGRARDGFAAVLAPARACRPDGDALPRELHRPLVHADPAAAPRSAWPCPPSEPRPRPPGILISVYSVCAAVSAALLLGRATRRSSRGAARGHAGGGRGHRAPMGARRPLPVVPGAWPCCSAWPRAGR